MLRPLVMAATLLAAATLAGCTDALSFGSAADDDDGTFTVAPETGGKDTVFTVRASGKLAGLNLTWDFGDGAKAYGAEAEHVYGFTNGVMTITLLAAAAEGLPQVATKVVTLGSGINKAPTGSMRAAKTWIEVGRPVNLTATGTDADRDPLSYLWTYTILEGGVADDGHGHDHGASGAPTGGEILIPGTDRRAAVTFDAPGRYDVKVRVKDPKGGEAVFNQTIQASARIPDAQVHVPFQGRLLAGTAGAGVSEKLWVESAPDTSADAARHAFELKYPATGYVFLRWNDSTNASVQDLDLELRDATTGEALYKGETHAVNASAPGAPVPLPPMEIAYGEIPAGKYLIVVRGHVAANVDYTVDLFATLRLTPELVAQVEGS